MTETINPNTVTKVYLGKDRWCRCGCGGEYVYPDNPKFEKRLKRFMKMWESYDPTDIDGSGKDNFRNVSFGKNRALTIYFD